MNGKPSERIVRQLVRYARWILPAESGDWGAAMEAEVGEMKDPGEKLKWAAGSLWVACRERLAALVCGRRRVVAGGDLLALEMEEGMRRLARAVIVAAAGAPLLFLLAPSFRQGLAVQARLWTASFNEPLVRAGELRAMASEAEKHGDAEALAFAALLHRDVNERAAWAEQAVGRQRDLTWLYAVLLSRAEHPAGAEVWLGALRRWAPDNGFVDVLEAKRIAQVEGSPGDRDYRQRVAKNVEWQAAMQAAFAAPVYDCYVGRQLELIRKVMRRERGSDPLLVVNASG